MKMNVKAYSQLNEKIKKDDSVRADFKEDPISALAKHTVIEDPLANDRWIYRLVVVALGITVIACVVGAIWITLSDKTAEASKEVPQIMVALGSAAVGALSGLLAPNPKDPESAPAPASATGTGVGP